MNFVAVVDDLPASPVARSGSDCDSCAELVVVVRIANAICAAARNLSFIVSVLGKISSRVSGTGNEPPDRQKSEDDMRKAVLVMLAASAVAAATIATVHFDTAAGREHSVRISPLFSTGVTVMGEPITYPTGAPAKLTGMIIAMAPGAETGWHTHSAPLAGIVIEGELTVDYGTRANGSIARAKLSQRRLQCPTMGKIPVPA